MNNQNDVSNGSDKNRPAVYPASFGQQRLWFLDRLQPSSAVYNVPAGLRLSGPVDPDPMRAALDLIVSRHDVLRTVFAERDGTPVQVVMPPTPGAFTVVDTDETQLSQ